MANLVGEIFVGSCPICPDMPEMKVNLDDHWECPSCGLLIRTMGEVNILPFKGKGEFRNPPVYAPDCLSFNSDLIIRKDFRT